MASFYRHTFSFPLTTLSICQGSCQNIGLEMMAIQIITTFDLTTRYTIDDTGVDRVVVCITR